MKIKAIVTGATGMVGEGVLLECLNNPDVAEVLALVRRTTGITHPKLKEILHGNFQDITPIADQLFGYNACYFCLGVSSVGISTDEYYSMTYTLTLHLASILAKQNLDMVFCYVSGLGTSNDVNKGSNWARVKGKTEHDLTKLPFRAVYNFRPGGMRPTKGQRYGLPYYKYFDWLYPAMRAIGIATTIAEVGQAMISVTQKGYPKSVLEIKDILAAAKA